MPISIGPSLSVEDNTGACIYDCKKISKFPGYVALDEITCLLGGRFEKM
jgi:hypothetical protein